jgi:hypothetical protein
MQSKRWSLADRRHFVDFKMGVSKHDHRQGQYRLCSALMCIAEGMYAMIIAEMEHINVM